jgi:RNA polymerase sigma-70 factor (ECF subfamily)
MANEELLPHLFRMEYRKIVSVLCRRFGFEYIETAEDITSDTFLTAAQTWSYKGVPENPTAWLYTVAKNKAKNHVHRDSLFKETIVPELLNNSPDTHEIDIDLSPDNINDSQLQMMFALCHPSLSPEAQIGLSLRILCGFGIDEIADAFLTNKETINKRLARAKEKLREEKIVIEFPDSSKIDDRLENVLKTIYLLFNEGYYSTSSNTTLRKDLCFEAMRLCTMLVEHKQTNTPPVNALLALMCFHASRFDARIDQNGEIVLYHDQDVNLWNTELINKGVYFLHNASTGNNLSSYHLQAAIAYWSTQQSDTSEKWETVLQLYNHLLQLEYSPIAALNRTFAFSKAHGKLKAIGEAEKLKLMENHFYHTLLGELYRNVDNEKSLEHFTTALSLAKTVNDKKTIQRKIDSV